MASAKRQRVDPISAPSFGLAGIAPSAPPRPWEEDAARAPVAQVQQQTVAVGCDHMGRERKDQLKEHLQQLGYTVDDFGTDNGERCDYPVFAEKVGSAVVDGRASWGLLVCGTGVGMSIAANKIRGVRAALVSDTFTAKMTRRHNAANVICVGSWVVGQGLARELLSAWTGADYEGGRHQRRVDQISALESGTRLSPSPRLSSEPTQVLSPAVVTLGEILVEVMRPHAGVPLKVTGPLVGPFPSGAPAIFIDAVARLGHGSMIVGAVGGDSFGQNVLERLQQNGVTTSLISQQSDLPTATAHVAYDEEGGRAFVFHIDNTAATKVQWPDPARLATVAPDAAWFHAMGCSVMASDQMRTQILAAVTCIADRGGKISFDPNLRPELLGDRDVIDVVGPILKRCNVLLSGIGELHMLAGKPDVSASADDVGASARSLFTSYPAIDVIAVKRGSGGASLFERGAAAAVDVPAVKVEREVDPTGAGDYFDAGFVVACLEGLPLRRCGEVACAAGAANTVALGPMEGALDRSLVGLPV